MKILIRGGRVVDPASGRDAVGDVAIADGPHRRASARAGADFERRRAPSMPRGLRRRAGARRPGGAAARAGSRARGMLESRNGRGGGRRRDQPRLPARHRPGARRAGPGRDAEVPRRQPEPGAALSARRADARPGRRGADRDGRAHRGRLRRLLAGRCPAAATRWCCTARCSTPRPSATRVWLRPNDAWLGGGVAAKGALATRLGLSGVPVLAETIALHDDLRAGARHRRARAPVPAVSSAAGVELVRAAKAEGLPVTCDVSINSAAPDRRRHRLLRLGDAPDAAAAPAARPRRDPRRRSPTARSTRSSATTRRSTTTPRTCRSPRPSPAPPGSNCCSAWRCTGARTPVCRCCRRSRR